MIILEFNSNGYSIVGDGLEIKLACSPTKFYDEIEISYIILIKALCEIKNYKADVICYNDSRIIDEINNLIEPISETSRILRDVIKREIIPTIKGIVFFRKRSVYISNFDYNNTPVLKSDPIKKDSIIERFKKSWKR